MIYVTLKQLSHDCGAMAFIRPSMTAMPRPTTISALALAAATAVSTGLIFASPTSADTPSTWLLGNHSSYSVTTTNGGGDVVLGLRAQVCQGSPTANVKVDGEDVGTVTVDATTPTIYTVSPSGTADAIAPGTHTVTVTMGNDFTSGAGCDRNLQVTSVGWSYTKPDAGVPDGTSLTTANDSTPVVGTQTVNGVTSQVSFPIRYVADSTGKFTYPRVSIAAPSGGSVVVSGWDIPAFVTLTGNVTLTNSKIRGGDTDAISAAHVLLGDPKYYQRFYLVTLTGGATISHSTVLPDDPNGDLIGIGGSNFTADGVDVSNTVDLVVTNGDNVTVQNSDLHDTWQAQHDYTWGLNGEPSHSDAWQIEGGSNLKLVNSYIGNPDMTGVIMTQNVSKTNNVQITGNYLSGGTCTINIHNNTVKYAQVSPARVLGSFAGVAIEDNLFGPVASSTFWTPITGCHINVQRASMSGVVDSDNLSTDGYAPVIRDGGA